MVLDTHCLLGLEGQNSDKIRGLKMAHFARVVDGIVEQVIVVNNIDITDENGDEQESLGIAFCNKLLGEAEWVQTSYNKNFRKNYAGKGFAYDQERDAFVHIKPFDSWVLNEDTCDWEPPVPQPDDYQSKNYLWHEDTTSWVEQ